MSTFVFGTPDHTPTCRQTGSHPPVLCGCRSFAIEPVTELDDFVNLPHSRVGRALRAFLQPIDEDAA